MLLPSFPTCHFTVDGSFISLMQTQSNSEACQLLIFVNSCSFHCRGLRVTQLRINLDLSLNNQWFFNSINRILQHTVQSHLYLYSYIFIVLYPTYNNTHNYIFLIMNWYAVQCDSGTCMCDVYVYCLCHKRSVCLISRH